MFTEIWLGSEHGQTGPDEQRNIDIRNQRDDNVTSTTEPRCDVRLIDGRSRQ